MTQQTGRHRRIVAVAASVLLACVGAVVLFLAAGAAEGPPQPRDGTSVSRPGPVSGPSATSGADPGTSAAAGDKGPDLGRVLTESRPVGIDIPSIGARTRNVVDLALARDGSLEVPTDYAAVGWYSGGVSPGQLGPAVLVGHVDSQNGPAIFYRLGALRPGSKITVARKDGSSATFEVDGIRRFAKDRFPTALVYGATTRSELRLVTCGGSFDQRTGHYVDNVVAFAHLI